MKSVVRGTDTEVTRGAPLKFRVCAKSMLAAGQSSGWRESTILDRIKWNSNPPSPPPPPPNQGWRRATAKTCHFPILNLRGREGSNFPSILSKIVAVRIDNHILPPYSLRSLPVLVLRINYSLEDARDLDSYPRGTSRGNKRLETSEVCTWPLMFAINICMCTNPQWL